MELNLTLVVQAIHFFVAYVLIKKLLFQPVFFIMAQDKSKQQRIEQAIDQKLKQVTAKHNEKEVQWRACENFFKLTSPTQIRLGLPAQKWYDTDMVIPEISTDMVQKQVKQVKNQIIKRVCHDSL